MSLCKTTVKKKKIGAAILTWTSHVKSPIWTVCQFLQEIFIITRLKIYMDRESLTAWLNYNVEQSPLPQTHFFSEYVECRTDLNPWMPSYKFWFSFRLLALFHSCWMSCMSKTRSTVLINSFPQRAYCIMYDGM